MSEVAIFTPLLGGALIGIAATLLLAFNGRIAGISGIVGGLLSAPRTDRGWRLAFIAGLVITCWLLSLVYPEQTAMLLPHSLPGLAVAGLLVGFGTRLGNGCTSGHGVCGVAQLSPRSLVAVGCFMLSAMLTVAVLRWLQVTP